MEKHGYDAAGSLASEDGGRRRIVRRAIRSLVILLVFLVATLTKPFKWLTRHYPYRLREMVRSWDYKMLWTFILSGGTRVFMDQNCYLPDPPSFKPKIQTRPEFQLTEEQIRQFYQDGFIGPITIWTPEEMNEIRRKVGSDLSGSDSRACRATSRSRPACLALANFQQEAR
jgi:hypothetical protein